MRFRLSTTARLVLLSTLLIFAANLAVLVLLYGQMRDDAMSQLREAVRTEGDGLAAAYRGGGVRALSDAAADLRDDDGARFVFRLYGPEAQGIDSFGAAPSTFPQTRAVSFAIADYGGTLEGERRDTAYSLRRIGPGWMLSGRLFDDRQQMQRTLERALLLSALMAIALGLIASGVIVFYVNRRLRGIAAVVDEAGAGNLTRRAALTSDGGDAFDGLARRVNHMLNRLEQLLGELRLMTDSFAHDLRSPLGRLRTKVERAAAMAEGPEAEAAMEAALAEIDVVLRMLTTLLQIGRVGVRDARDRLERIEPGEVMATVAELYEPVMEDRCVALSLTIAPDLPRLRLHRSLLSQALSNLIDNALHHGRDRIALEVMRRGGDIAFIVTDNGPGIAASDRGEALRRFGRLDAARAKPGAGLGLALVEAVARQHGGRLALDDAAPGLIAVILIPADRDLDVNSPC